MCAHHVHVPLCARAVYILCTSYTYRAFDRIDGLVVDRLVARAPNDDERTWKLSMALKVSHGLDAFIQLFVCFTNNDVSACVRACYYIRMLHIINMHINL